MTDEPSSQWSFPPGVTYLNHGSFGPSPRCVSEARAGLQQRLEAEPMDFFLRQLPGQLAQTRERLARFVGSDAADLALVDNATMGMNVVAATVALQPGDEVLCNNHEYGAVLRLWEHKCEAAGAKLVVCDVPLPLHSPDAVVEALSNAMTDHTRLLVFSHVTSPTAVIIPAEAICREARRRDVTVCIDGPHAVAMLPLDLHALDCDFYTASCHKWLSAPFGSGFLYVHPRWQSAVRPAVVSWGRPHPGEEARWTDEYDWLGTRDPSAILAIPTALDFLEDVGLDTFRDRTHELACYARRRLSELTGLEPLVPDARSWYGSMTALPLPPGEAEPIQRALWEQHRIEAPVIDWHGQRLIRVSCHLYNDESDIDRLVDVFGRVIWTNE